MNERSAAIREFEKKFKDQLADLSGVLPGAEQFVNINLEDASLQFDNGATFFGSFHESVDSLNALDSAVAGADGKIVEAVDVIMRRHLHLLIQLCLLNPDNLESLFNLYSASAAVVERDPSATRHVLACRIIKSELCNILPSLSSSFPAERVLGRVLGADPLARKLVILTLETLYSGVESRASVAVVENVKHYAARHAIFDQYKKKVEDASASTPEASLLLKLATTELLIPVVSGLSAADIVDQIPLVIALCLRYRGDLEDATSPTAVAEGGEPAVVVESAPGGGDASLTALFHAFSRITRGRPPALSKAGLLYALHRYDEA